MGIVRLYMHSGKRNTFINIFGKRINMETRSVIVGISILVAILGAVWQFMEGNVIWALVFIIATGFLVLQEIRRAPADS